MSTTAPDLSEAEVPDAGLLDRLSDDVDAGFAELVVGYQRAVFTTALRLAGQQADAEDLAAETFLRAYGALRRYPSARIRQLQVRPWLITILLNLWRNQVRAASRRPAEVLATGPDPRPMVEAPVDRPDDSPEGQAQCHEAGDLLATGLAELPERQRLGVVLRHVVGLSHAEIAEILGCPESTAKSHVRRGLARLRAVLPVPTTEETLS